jgi:hypothetical protein
MRTEIVSFEAFKPSSSCSLGQLSFWIDIANVPSSLSRIGASLELIEQTVSEMRLFVERFVHI